MSADSPVVYPFIPNSLPSVQAEMLRQIVYSDEIVH